MHASPNNQSDAEEMNTLMSNIILSREKEKEQNKTVVGLTDSPNIKLDCLPKRLVGEISSFLSQSDYINLSKTNRFIYMGCNSPNKLLELRLMDVKVNHGPTQFMIRNVGCDICGSGDGNGWKMKHV
eukprot:963848_1